MSYNGSGVYTLPGAALANGEIVSATENNQFRNDVAAALNIAWTRDGQAPATANIPMGSHKLTGLAAGTGVGDSVRFEQLPSATNKLDLTTSVTGTLPVANGGSGAATLTGVLKGNGTSAFTAAVAGTDYLAPAAIGTTVQGYAAELQGATQGGINGMKNRIINGAMMIDQRNNGADTAVSATTQYVLDRWRAIEITDGSMSVQRSTNAPAGFSNSMKFTVTSADSSLAAGQLCGFDQAIEGYNVADLGFGTANAATVAISFWVNCSLTGTFAAAIRNEATNRSYVFNYTISAANTWERKTVTIAGDTTGTWGTTNNIGMYLTFSLGTGTDYQGTAGTWAANAAFNTSGAVSVIGTNGATFYITGVQLEKGSTATSFDYRPYGAELALCQRYYEKSYNQSTVPGTVQNNGIVMCGDMGSFGACQGFRFAVTKRTAPTITGYSENGTSGQWTYPGSSGNTVTFGDIADTGVRYTNVTGRGANPIDGHFTASAEL